MARGYKKPVICSADVGHTRSVKQKFKQWLSISFSLTCLSLICVVCMCQEPARSSGLNRSQKILMLYDDAEFSRTHARTHTKEISENKLKLKSKTK